MHFFSAFCAFFPIPFRLTWIFTALIFAAPLASIAALHASKALMKITSNPDQATVSRLTRALMSIGCAGLLSDSFLHTLPKCFKAFSPCCGKDVENTCPLKICNQTCGLAILAGILFFFSMSFAGKIFDSNNNGKYKIIVFNTILSRFIHNIAEGMALKIACYTDCHLARRAFCQMFFHEVIHEVTEYGIFVVSGISHSGAFVVQFISTFGVVLGALLGFLFQGSSIPIELQRFTSVLLAFASGGFILVAMTVILPVFLSIDSTPREKIETLSCFVISVAIACTTSYHK